MSLSVSIKIFLLSLCVAASLWGCSASKKTGISDRAAVAESATSFVPEDAKRPSYRDEAIPRYSLYNVPIQNSSRHHNMTHHHYGVNPTIDTRENAISTFSADVNTASWSLAKAYLYRGILPDEAAIRVEEMLNAFDYRYHKPDKQLFSIQAEAFPSPHRKAYHVLQIGLQGKTVAKIARKPVNLLFLIDVSGSMAMQNRLELVKHSLGMLLNQLYDDDYISIVAFNDSAWIALDSTPASDHKKITQSLTSLHPQGNTNVQKGLAMAYNTMQRGYRSRYNNRIILASDGVANTGLTNVGEIFSTIEGGVTRGVSLTAVGVGMGNYNDHLLEQIAHKGNGHYLYINDLKDAHHIFVKNIVGNIQLLAKDVKIQVEFDPNQVMRYRLLGYEKRSLSNRDFDDDRKNAAEVGAGHSVTAIYEVKFKSLQEPYFGNISIRYKHPNSSHIVKDIDSLAFLVKNILSYNRLKKYRWVLHREPVDVRSLIAAVISEMPMYTSKSLKVDFIQIPTDIYADTQMLKLLFLNLFRNACYYNKNSEVKISIDIDRNNPYQLLLQDNGIGIPQTQWKNVFTEFTRLANDSSPQVRGTGLGLSICRKIMLLHKGDIRIDSSSDQGTRFMLSFGK